MIAALKKKLSKLVNFYVAILILKMGEKSNIFSMLCFIISRKIKTQLKYKKKQICAVNGEGTVTDRTCQKWLVKFRAGDFLLDSARTGKPVDVDSNQMETLTENNQCYTTGDSQYTPNIQIKP